MRHQTVPLAFIFIVSIIGIGLLVSSLVSYNWFLIESLGIRDGLWRSCSNLPVERCAANKDVLTFKSLRQDRDILLVVDIGAIGFTIMAIFIVMCGLCKGYRSKCIEVAAALFFILSALCSIFMVVYAEVEVIKDSKYERGWAIYTFYGGAGAQSITAILASIYAVCCRRGGVDKSDSIVLKAQRTSLQEMKYQPTLNYLNGLHNDSYKSSRASITIPVRDY